MTKEEKLELKKRYFYLKKIYKRTKRDAQMISKDSLEYYELLGSLSVLRFELYKMRAKLLADWQSLHPLNVLDNLVFGKDEVERGSR